METPDREFTEEELKIMMEERANAVERGDKVNPEDFTEAEHAAVDAMAAPLIRQAKADKSFKGRRNRDAWMRMNRPHKLDQMEKGGEKIFKLLDRAAPLPEEPEEVLEEVV